MLKCPSAFSITLSDISNNYMISFGLHQTTTSNQDANGIHGYFIYPVSFSSDNLAIVGSCADAGDTIQFINHTSTQCQYTVYDRAAVYQVDCFFFIIIGY